MANPVNRGTGFPQQGQGQEAAGGVMSTVKEKAQEFMSTAGGRAGDAWESTRQGAQQMASHMADTAGESWDSVSQFFNRYPVPMFLAGIGLGFLVSKALDNLSGDMTRRMSYADRGDYGSNR